MTFTNQPRRDHTLTDQQFHARAQHTVRDLDRPVRTRQHRPPQPVLSLNAAAFDLVRPDLYSDKHERGRLRHKKLLDPALVAHPALIQESEPGIDGRRFRSAVLQLLSAADLVRQPPLAV